MTPLKRILVVAACVVAGAAVLAAAAVAVFVATFDANRYKPMAADWVQQRYGRTLAIEGPIELAVFPRLALAVHDARLSEARQDGRFAEVAQARVALELLPLLRGQVRASRVTASGVRLAWTRDAQGRSNIDDLLGGAPAAGAAPGPAASPGGLPDIDIAGIELQDVELRVKDALGGMEGNVSLARFTAGRIAPGVETPVELQAALHLRQPAVEGSLQGDTQLRLARPAAAGSPLQVELGTSRLAFTGEAAGLRFAKAEIKLTGTRHAAAERRVELDGLELGLEVSAPGLPSQALQLRGSANASPGAVGWNLAGEWRAPGNTSSLRTDGRYLMDGGTIEAKADMGAVDLDALRREPGQPPARQRESRGSEDRQREAHAVKDNDKGRDKSAGQGADTPIDLTPARALHGRVEASLGRLTAGGVVFTDMRATLRGDGRTLVVEPFSAKVWNGRIDGRAQAQPAAQASAQRVRLAATATGIRIEQAQKDLSGRDSVQGNGRLELDVDTTGATLAQWRQRLAGRAAVQLRDASVKGYNLAALGRQAKAALAQKRDEAEAAKATEQTDFSELSASFAIAGGVARSTDLSGKSPYLRVTGRGAVDIGKSSIDYTVLATLTDTSKGQGGAELASLGGVQVPVRLTGPLDNVQYQVQWSAVGGAVAREAALQKLEEKLGIDPNADAKTRRDALREKAREKLKGLFK